MAHLMVAFVRAGAGLVLAVAISLPFVLQADDDRGAGNQGGDGQVRAVDELPPAVNQAATGPDAANADAGKNGDQQPQAAEDAKEDAKGQKQDAEKKGQQQKEKPRELMMFELEHRTPQELQQVLSVRWQPHLHHGFAAAPSLQQRVGYRGLQQMPALAIDAESGTLFVRGTQEQLDEVKKLVEALDVPKDQLKQHTFDGTMLIPVGQEEAARIRTILTQLQLDQQILQVGDVSFVVMREGETDEEQAAVEQAVRVIQKLSGKDKEDKDQDEQAAAPSDESDENQADADNGDEGSAEQPTEPDATDE